MAMAKNHEVLLVRLPPGTKKLLRRAGVDHGESMNQVVCRMLKEALALKPQRRKAA
jgi:hypothetical protein